MHEKLFIKKQLEGVDQSQNLEKTTGDQANYLQTIFDLGRSYFYINGEKCSIRFDSSIDDAKKKILSSLNKISTFHVDSTNQLVRFIFSTLNLNNSLYDVFNVMNECKKRCLAAYRNDENNECTLSSSLGKSLYYLKIDKEAKPLTLHELRVLILETSNEQLIPIEFFSCIHFHDPQSNTSSFRQGKFKISTQKIYMAREADMLLNIALNQGLENITEYKADQEKRKTLDPSSTKKHKHHINYNLGLIRVSASPNMKEELKKLSGDTLKSNILTTFQEELNSITDQDKLTNKIDEFIQSSEYHVLKKSQGITSKVFGLKTTSVRTFEDMCRQAEERLIVSRTP